MVEWKIYYSNGFEIKTFSSKDGGPEIAPTKDVQVIVQIDPDHGWSTQSHADFYIWDSRGGESRWWGVDIIGLSDYFDKPGWKRVLKGTTVSGKEFTKIFKMALEDDEFPKKTAYYRNERRPD
jgi:hypothetical protein